MKINNIDGNIGWFTKLTCNEQFPDIFNFLQVMFSGVGGRGRAGHNLINYFSKITETFDVVPLTHTE